MKNVYEVLYKYLEKINYSKTNLYKQVDLEIQLLKDQHIAYNFKSDLDVFLGEIAIQAVKNKKVFDEAYNHFLSENFDLISHVNYEQRRKLYEPEIQAAIEKCPHFDYEDKPIFIPYLEDFVNERYVVDYEVLTLKKHEQYLHDYKKDIQNSISLYGSAVLESDFSSLVLLYKDDEKCYFYHEELRVIYIIKFDGSFDNELILVDKKYKDAISVTQAKEILNVFLESNHVSYINFMMERGYIEEKTGKKIIKKLEKLK